MDAAVDAAAADAARAPASRSIGRSSGPESYLVTFVFCIFGFWFSLFRAVCPVVVATAAAAVVVAVVVCYCCCGGGGGRRATSRKTAKGRVARREHQHQLRLI